MIVTANARLVLSIKAKINTLTGKLETTSVILPIAFQDSISIDQFGRQFMDVVHFANHSVHISERAIIDNALRIMREQYKYHKTYSIKIYKNIPTGHGLGSGASNAMTIVKNIARFEKISISKEELITLATCIGGDAPFFAQNKPMLYDQSTQTYTPIQVNHNPHILLLIHPKTTEKRDIFNMFLSKGESNNKELHPVISKAEKGTLRELGEVLTNDFTDVILDSTPDLRAVLNDLKTQKVEAFGIAGIGTSVFALSSDKNLLKYIAEKYKKLKYQVVLTKIIK